MYVNLLYHKKYTVPRITYRIHNSQIEILKKYMDLL